MFDALDSEQATEIPMRFYLVTLMATLVLFGCAGTSVSKNQCLASDWQTLGYRDGVMGRRSTQLLEHQDACLDHGVTPDRHGYMIGWNQGAREYCQPNNAFDVGERGAGHNNICPTGLAGSFLGAYQQGRKLFLARSAIAKLERLIHQKEYRVEQIKAEIVSSATDQLNPALAAAERIELLSRTKRLADERTKLGHELPALHDELDDRIRDLEVLNASLAGAYSQTSSERNHRRGAAFSS